jgi:hypothetical protein
MLQQNFSATMTLSPSTFTWHLALAASWMRLPAWANGTSLLPHMSMLFRPADQHGHPAQVCTVQLLTDLNKLYILRLPAATVDWVVT